MRKMKLIILTSAYDGSKVYVNRDHVSTIFSNNNNESIVTLMGDRNVVVKESPESIVKLIELGWK